MRRATMLAAVIGAMALAGCASGAGDDADVAEAGAAPGPSGSAPAATHDGAGGAEASAMPDAAPADDDAGTDASSDPDNAFAFTGMTLAGEEFDGLTLDDRDVILWFWAPWCPTCFAEAGPLTEAMDRLPDGVEMVGIAGLSDDQAAMEKFVTDAQVEGMTHVADLDGSIWKRFDVVTQATVLVIDDSGDAYTLGGGVTADQLVDYAEKIAST
ncbi:redoxin domain-containing protein [Demequina iriomotensis]|uniref:redoxin domain-containing protein n=1 Tax=Demequina iriomotensis TaxID=1536641 RepID=UPI0007822178|nr:redoxin domain-containing protein [Demequina iriomotensis]